MSKLTRVVGLFSLFSLVIPCAQSAVAATIEVDAVGLTFQPANVTISVGDSVHWTGLLGGFHSVAEVDTPADLAYNGAGFHSAAGASELTFTFNSPGLFHYICEPHVLSNMRGTVTVNGVVPTVSEWGLMVLALLVLTAGSVLIVRRVREQRGAAL